MQENISNRIIAGSDLFWDILNIKGYGDSSHSTLNLAADSNKISGGVYVQDELSLSESVIANAGGRYELGFISVGSSTTSQLTGEKYHNAFVYDIGLTWNFVKSSKLYAKFATVYRYPFTDEQVSYYGFGGNYFNQNIEAETGYDINTGIGISLFNKLIDIDAGFFLLDMANEISYNTATSRNENLDKTRHMGVESSVSIPVKDILNLKVDYTYTYAYFLEGVNSGDQVPLVSNHMVNAEASFYLPFGFVIAGSFRFVSDFFQGGDYKNTQQKAAGYKVMDLSLRYKHDYVPGKLELSFSLSNLLNEKYSTTAYFDSYGGLSYYYPAPGLTWKLGATYRY